MWRPVNKHPDLLLSPFRPLLGSVPRPLRSPRPSGRVPPERTQAVGRMTPLMSRLRAGADALALGATALIPLTSSPTALAAAVDHWLHPDGNPSSDADYNDVCIPGHICLCCY